MYALNLNSDNRILSACKVLPNGNYNSMTIVNNIPEGNIYDYLYINNEFVHDPIPLIETEPQPSQLDILEAQVTYTAMMTDTLLEV